MPVAHLTDITVKALAPPATGQITYTDDTLPGFGVRVSQGGVKSFVLVYGPRRARVTIGRYPIISLAEARTEAKTILAQRTLRTPQYSDTTFDAALADFLNVHARNTRPRSAYETKRLLTRHFLPSLSGKPLVDISTQDVSRVIDGLLETRSLANHAFTAARTLFRWAAKRRLIPHSPLDGLKLPSRPVSRERVLTPQELAKVYAVAVKDGTQFGALVQLLILTGQRRGEIAGLRAEMIDRKRRAATLPPALTKNKRQHTFPLGDAALRLIKTLPPEGLLFPARGKDTSFNGYSKCKAAFDEKCPIAPWTLHDLRRTFATNLAALGVPVHVTEKLLNHASGSISGVAAIYNRHTYEKEMREAIAAWEKHLKALRSRR